MSVYEWVDTAADRLVLPGYSRIGYRLRRRYWPADPPPDVLTGTHALVTGASSGLGQATVGALAQLGATVHLLVRNRDRGEQAVGRIVAHSTVPGSRLTLEICDISDLAAVEEFAADFARRCPRLGILVHNAGVMPPTRTKSAQGHELALATHVLGPHLLTEGLGGALRGSGQARVVWVSSGGMYGQRLDVEDLEYRRGPYSPATAYARTKRMQVVLSTQWAHRLLDRGIVVHAMHPGWADTPGVATSMPRFYRLTRPLLRTPEQGADTIVWLCAAALPRQSTGQFWHDRRTRPVHYLRRTHDTAAERDQLWRSCQGLVTKPW
jgi:NAD(P)-dependent dehydrogenase (short-subunit alcohol dehydrogenase family)